MRAGHRYRPAAEHREAEMSVTTTSPLVVTGRLDEHLSRWLWLFKWVLALPHYLVLALLWPVFVLTTAVAGVGILLTGHYPRGIFDLNAGILRWTWRVNYYSYGALGTDRYPPFTLADVADYPARLQISYPEHLSRGLVLVKWWLLALPHYLVVAVLLGGGWWVFGEWADDGGGLQAPGLIGLLVLVAGVTLAFSGRYPQGLFDLVVGLNRWVLRVAAYAGLMTDEYPPFRLDLGGAERGTHTIDVGQRPTSPQVPPPASARGGSTVALVLGTVLLLPSLALLGAGTAALWADQTQRDAAGFVTSELTELSTSGHALVTEPLDLQLHGPDAAYLDDIIGDVRLQATAELGRSVFVGVARTPDVMRYLTGVQYSLVEEVRGMDDVSYLHRPGSATPAPPAEQDFWLVSDSGPGTRSISTAPQDGQWTAVVMNPDGSAGLSVDAAAAVEAPVLGWVAGALLVAGGVLTAAAVTLLVVGARRGAGSWSQPAVPSDTTG